MLLTLSLPLFFFPFALTAHGFLDNHDISISSCLVVADFLSFFVGLLFHIPPSKALTYYSAHRIVKSHSQCMPMTRVSVV